MPVIQQQSVLPYTAEQMYRLVNDVPHYPAFLPLCTQAKVISSEDEKMSAQLTIQKGPINVTFTTQNQLQPFKRIEMQLVDGPFHHLQGIWQFKQQVATCEVSLMLDFEVKGTLLKLTLSPIFQVMAQNMIQSFSQRAAQVYG